MTEEEMQKYFPTVFPEMFKGKYGGIATGKGWFNILVQLCQNIQHHIDWRKASRLQAMKYNEMAAQCKVGNFDMFEEEYKSILNHEFKEQRLQEIIDGDYRLVSDEISQVIVEQVKEKFGTLRFYYQGGDDYIDGLVAMAESMSGVTCEECGNPGESHSGGWIRTLCQPCEEARELARKRADEEWEQRKLLKEGFEQ
jgi:hypothetical protein